MLYFVFLNYNLKLYDCMQFNINEISVYTKLQNAVDEL